MGRSARQPAPAHQLPQVTRDRTNIADFCSPKLKLIIELDGNPHHTRQEADAERTQYLEALGYRVLRFWNSRVMEDLNGVLQEIRTAIEKIS